MRMALPLTIVLTMGGPLGAASQEIDRRPVRTARDPGTPRSANVTCKDFLAADPTARRWFIAGVNEGADLAEAGIQGQLIAARYYAAGNDHQAGSLMAGLRVAEETVNNMLPDEPMTVGELADGSRQRATRQGTKPSQ